MTTPRRNHVRAINALQNIPGRGSPQLAAEIERLVLYTDEGAYIGVEHISPRVRPADAFGATAGAETPADLEHLIEISSAALSLRRCGATTTRRAGGHRAWARLAPDPVQKLKRLAITRRLPARRAAAGTALR